jgi:hypothetical protein
MTACQRPIRRGRIGFRLRKAVLSAYKNGTGLLPRAASRGRTRCLSPVRRGACSPPGPPARDRGQPSLLCARSRDEQPAPSTPREVPRFPVRCRARTNRTSRGRARARRWTRRSGPPWRDFRAEQRIGSVGGGRQERLAADDHDLATTSNAAAGAKDVLKLFAVHVRPAGRSPSAPGLTGSRRTGCSGGGAAPLGGQAYVPPDLPEGARARSVGRGLEGRRQRARP